MSADTRSVAARTISSPSFFAMSRLVLAAMAPSADDTIATGITTIKMMSTRTEGNRRRGRGGIAIADAASAGFSETAAWDMSLILTAIHFRWYVAISFREGF